MVTNAARVSPIIAVMISTLTNTKQQPELPLTAHRERLLPEGVFPLTETVRPQLGLQREVTLTSSSLFVLFGQQTYPLMPINPAFCTHALLKWKLGHGWHRPCSVYTLGLQNRSFQSCTLRKKKDLNNKAAISDLHTVKLIWYCRWNQPPDPSVDVVMSQRAVFL